MFIVWGKKTVYRKLGYVADFCSICRSAQPFSVRRIGMAGHVYYITLGKGVLIGHDRSCLTCKTACATDPALYAAFAKRTGAIGALLGETFPNFAQRWHDRLALEETIRHSPQLLSAEDRAALIREPFLRLSPQVETRFASLHLDKEVGFAIVGAIGMMTFAKPLASRFAPDQTEVALLTAVAFGVALVVWQIANAGQRYMRRAIVPTLITALRPLRPSDSELQAVLAELKRLGHKIGAKLRAKDLRGAQIATDASANARAVRVT